MNCPHCGQNIPLNLITTEWASIAGSKGKGKAKARTSEQARAAVMARWAKRKKAK